jgi:hypothetical protein
MFILSKSGRAAAMSSALTSGFELSDGGRASGAYSNLGKSTSILNLIESSVG